MSYDINIIAINQKTPCHFKSETSLLLHNEVEHREVHRYAYFWPFFSNTNGILYPVVEELDDDFFACFNFCDSLFEEPDVQGVQISLWISVEAKDDLTPLLIRDHVKNEFLKIIKHVLLSSPAHRILFQSRYQCSIWDVLDW